MPETKGKKADASTRNTRAASAQEGGREMLAGGESEGKDVDLQAACDCIRKTDRAVEELVQAARVLPRVEEDGTSECPFAEELYARKEEAQMEVEKFWMGALRRAVEDGDVDHGSLMAGQSVGLVDRIEPVAEIIRELANDIETELGRVRQLLGVRVA